LAVTLTGTGGLFTRIGRIAFAIKSANLYLGNTDLSAGGLKAAGVSTTDILAQFASALQNVPDGITQQRDALRQTLAGWKSQLQFYARSTVIEQVHADANLTEKSIGAAIKELIRQMIGGGTLYAADNDVDASVVSGSSAAVATNTGTGGLAISVVRPDGRTNDLLLAEVMEAICVSDSQLAGSTTARREVFTVRGETAVSDQLGWDWPAGSGVAATITATDSDQDASGNLLYGSHFDDFTTANQPDYWGAALVGAYGTDILEEASTVNRAGKALEFIGTGGAPLSSIAQVFDADSVAVADSGTTTELEPNTVYCWGAWIRKSASLATGEIQVRLIDGSNATVNDDAGTANATTIANGTLTTSFALYTGFFRTPKVLPSTIKFNVRVSTALTSGESVFIDDLAFCEAVDLYGTGNGPWAAIFPGATNFILNDQFNVTIANDRGGEIQEWFERLFGMRSLGLQLPNDSGGTESIADSLIA